MIRKFLSPVPGQRDLYNSFGSFFSADSATNRSTAQRTTGSMSRRMFRHRISAVVLYDPQTRSALQTSQPFPSRNNKRDKLITNADGSIDLYFGPEAPAGKEANWVQTVPGKGWFTIFRLYGPLHAWFDKTWKPGEMEQVKWSRERATE